MDKPQSNLDRLQICRFVWCVVFTSASRGLHDFMSGSVILAKKLWTEAFSFEKMHGFVHGEDSSMASVTHGPLFVGSRDDKFVDPKTIILLISVESLHDPLLAGSQDSRVVSVPLRRRRRLPMRERTPHGLRLVLSRLRYLTVRTMFLRIQSVPTPTTT